MRVRLLNSGGFKELENINFPVDVEAVGVFYGVAHIHKKELKKCKGGQDLNCFTDDIFCFQLPFFELLLGGGKPFDITQHEWSDSQNLNYVGERIGEDKSLFEVAVSSGDALFDLDKNDAIAIAKHFNLTAEDLK